MSTLTILIAGAGIGGLTAAAALAQRGAKVIVFEKSKTLGEVGAGLQQGPNAMHVHEALGIREAIEAAGYAPKNAVMRDYHSGETLFKTPLNPSHQERYGQKYITIHRADLHRILLHAAKDAGAQIHLGEAITDYSQSRDAVTILAGGIPYSGDALIGADGIHSKIRAHMLGEQTPHFTGQVAWRGTIPASKAPSGFMDSDVTAWLGPHKHFISYAIRGGELINFVAIEEREAWAQEGWSHKGNLATMRKAFDDWDGPVTAIMEAAESCFLWGLFDRPPLERWSDGRVCLLGDACHPMLPFMAQGAAMAVEDSWALTDRIMNYPASIPAALRAYAAARKPRAELMQKLSSDNAKLFHRASPAARTLRDLKFKAGMAMPSAVHAKLDKIYGVNVTKC